MAESATRPPRRRREPAAAKSASEPIYLVPMLNDLIATNDQESSTLASYNQELERGSVSDSRATELLERTKKIRNNARERVSWCDNLEYDPALTTGKRSAQTKKVNELRPKAKQLAKDAKKTIDELKTILDERTDPVRDPKRDPNRDQGRGRIRDRSLRRDEEVRRDSTSWRDRDTPPWAWLLVALLVVLVIIVIIILLSGRHVVVRTEPGPTRTVTEKVATNGTGVTGVPVAPPRPNYIRWPQSGAEASSIEPIVVRGHVVGDKLTLMATHGLLFKPSNETLATPSTRCSTIPFNTPARIGGRTYLHLTATGTTQLVCYQTPNRRGHVTFKIWGRHFAVQKGGAYVHKATF
jgi:hypothetical protein